MEFIKRIWVNNYEVVLDIPEATLVVLDSVLDCSKLALRNKGLVYAAKMFDGDVMLCCRADSMYRHYVILLFIHISGSSIDLHCSLHKKRYFYGYSSESKIYSALGITEDEINELKPYCKLLSKIINYGTATEDEVNKLVDAVSVIMSLAFCIDFSCLDRH